MVVRMMRWRPWPPLVSKKYEVRLIVRRMEGWDRVREAAAAAPGTSSGDDVKDISEKLTVEIRWKGPKLALSSLRRTVVKRDFTKEVEVCGGGEGENGGVLVSWDEEFESLCTLTAHRENVFHPWEISFTVFNGVNQGLKNKVPGVGSATVNLAEFASAAEQKEFELRLPLMVSAGVAEPCPLLCVSLSLLELRTAPETSGSVQRAIVPIPSSPQSGEAVSTEKDELSAIKAGLRKVKILTGYVSTRRAKKACREEEGSEGRCSVRSEDGEDNYNYPFDSESLDDLEEGESDEVKEDSTVRKSFSYGTLAFANYAGGSLYSSARINAEDEDWFYYSNRKSDVGCSHSDNYTPSVSEPSVLQNSKRGILSWRKRKLSFRSPKAKGEPLLKKAYGEEGGDDIDFDRRQLSSDESTALGWQKAEEDTYANRSSVSEFGDDNFSIGSWEKKEVISRDGQMKLQTEVFFASIDQRSEQAAGESACTALVANIADWFQNNHGLMPIKSQFDSLIREGSLEWRNLCENETYRERFPDKHFDLETVLQAKIRSLSAVPSKSFIGFFHPDGMDEGRFDFLHGAMSFDNIWDEISRTGLECPSDGEPQVYIVSWNDHFFILKVEPEAYYIIDTLGERLYEGCNQAYILKFGSNTIIRKLPNAAESSDEKTMGDQRNVPAIVELKDQQQVNLKEEAASTSGALVTKPEEPFTSVEPLKSEEEGEVMCQGKDSCKEYIKSFLAAIPIRELQADIKKGLMASKPLHHQLQIEFHYTQYWQPSTETHATEMSIELPRSANASISEAAV
ncbi:F26K24.5 PROTEIN [Salix koriyanagi]|uniref:F26K24.5 PROTEIN n=1 Tax=Salix koriyanagi TaxID=2511006 RepID=A0A9Q0X3G5_9ROSI|nr:F26K24.5 PROTEIN [Salix koriyanagi]